jgi:major membrane immunogen (membrane-anchored lipoprotein)
MIIELNSTAINVVTNEKVVDARCAIRSDEIIFFHEAFDDNGIPDGTTLHFKNGDIMDVNNSYKEVYKKIIESEIDNSF